VRHPQPCRRLLQRRHHDLGLLDPRRPAGPVQVFQRRDPAGSYRPRHSSTVGRLTPTFSAIAVLPSPSAANNTIRALLASPDRTAEARTQPSNLGRSASRRTNGATRIDMLDDPKNQP